MTADNTQTSSSKQGTTLRKYSNIIIYIVLLIVSVGGLFLYNIYMSAQLAKSTTAINLASRQSILVQQMAKEVMNIDLITDDILVKIQETAQTSSDIAKTEPEDKEREALQSSDGVFNAIEQLKKSKSIFDNTLTAFAQGGETTSLTNDSITLDKVTNPDGASSIANAQELWAPYMRLMDSFIDNLQTGKINKDAIGFTVDYARTFNNQLYHESNDLVKALENEAQAKTKVLQTVQTIGIGISILFFLLIVFGSLRQLVRSDKQLAVAQKQTDDIMHTVNEGLFLIDKDLTISDQHSAKLEEILHKKDIAGKNFYDILEGVISEKDMGTTKRFIEQLYNSWVVEELIQDLNPLKQVALSYTDDDGLPITKFLEFNFLRVLNEHTEEVDSVFVSVTDITKEVNLQSQMQKDKEQHNRQIEMISYLLSVDGTQLTHFIRETKQRIGRMNKTLKDQDTDDLKAKAQLLYRETHSLKGDASAVNLSALVDIAHKQEAILKQILEHTNLKGNDFLPFTIGLNDMIDMLSFIENLLARLHIGTQNDNANNLLQSEQPILHAPTNNATNPSEDLAPKGYWQGYFEQYANAIAERQNKKIAVHVTGFDEISTSDDMMSAYKDIATQLLKNAIVHGIEDADERLQKEKNITGWITLSLTEGDDGQNLTIKDDGTGINWEKIRQKAVEAGHVTTENAHNLTQKELVRIMFLSGVSTAETPDEDAGRGVGMDIIKTLASEYHAKISISSKPNQFTKVSIHFPKNTQRITG